MLKIIKSIILKNWILIVFLLIGLSVVIFGIADFNSYIKKQKIDAIRVKNYQQITIDNIRTEIESIKNKELDSLKKQNYMRISELSKKVYYYENLTNKNKKLLSKKIASVRKSDTINSNCEDLKAQYMSVVDSLTLLTFELDTLNMNLDNEAKTYSENLYICEEQLKIVKNTSLRKDSLLKQKDAYINILEKNVNTKNRWFGGFKVGYVAGFGSAVGCYFLLKK